MPQNILAAIPVLHVSASKETEDFYCQSLGFTKQWDYRPAAPAPDPAHLGLQRDGVRLHLSSCSGDGVRGGVAAFYVQDVDALFAPRQLSFVSATHPALHPGRSAQIHLGEQVVGWIGELHPQWQQRYDMPKAAVWFEVDMDMLSQATVPRMGEISKFLPVRRDLAVVADEAVTVQILL